MRIVLAIPVLIGVLAGAAAAGPGEGVRDPHPAHAVPVAIPTGPARNCVSIALLDDSIVRSDRVIDFRTGERTGYRVVLPRPCPSLGAERRFAFGTSLGQLCATDIITVLYDTPLGRGPSCGLAPFQPVTFPRH